jgi:hypothetical protein
MLANFFSFSDLVHAQVAENEGEAVVGHASSKDRVGVTPPKLLKIIIITILVRPLVQHSSFLFPDIFTLFTINSQKLGSFLIRSKNKIPPFHDDRYGTNPFSTSTQRAEFKNFLL